MDDLTINTVARNFATKLVLAALGWLGGALVVHGLATEDQVRQALDPVAQIIAGVLVTGGGMALTWYRAREKRLRETKLLDAKPGEVAVK